MSKFAELRRMVEAMTDAVWTLKPTARAEQSLMVRGDDYRASTQLPTEDAAGIVALHNLAIDLIDIGQKAEAYIAAMEQSRTVESGMVAMERYAEMAAAVEQFGGPRR